MQPNDVIRRELAEAVGRPTVLVAIVVEVVVVVVLAEAVDSGSDGRKLQRVSVPAFHA